MLVKDLAEKDLRMDKREFKETRQISYDLRDNMLTVRSGSKTSDSLVIFSFVKTESIPFQDKPSEGIFQINLEKGKKNDILLNFLQNTYIKSKCIAMSDLCIKFNQSVYCVTIEIFPIQTNGDLFRLCVSGINKIIQLLEIKKFFLPEIYQFSGVCKKILNDPTENEIAASDWQMNVVMKSTREFLSIDKSGEGIPNNIFTSILDESKSQSLPKPF